jgi:hypothetical protein
LDFAEKLAQSGLVQLKHAGRSVMVELNGGFEDSDAPATDLKVRSATDEAGPADVRSGMDGARSTMDGASNVAHMSRLVPQGGGEQRPPVEVVGDNAEGVRVVGDLLRAATNARWPMYLRNVKQVLRAANFDERSYGFGGLMDLLRACQREGLMQVERDRRRGLRVFQGAALMPGGASRSQEARTELPRSEPMAAADGDFPESLESSDDVIEIGNALDPRDIRDIRDINDINDMTDGEPAMLVDTTAELLGRAKPKRPRARAAAASAPRRVTKKAAPAHRASRGRKTTGQAKDE